MADKPSSTFSRVVQTFLGVVLAWKATTRPDAGTAIAMVAGVAVGFCMFIQTESLIEIFTETRGQPSGECALSVHVHVFPCKHLVDHSNHSPLQN